MSDENTEKPAPEAPVETPAPETPAVDATTAKATPVDPSPQVIGASALDWVFLVVVTVVTAGADLWSKAWAMTAIASTKSSPPPLCTPPPGEPHYLPQRMATREIVLIKDLLDFQYAENCGGAFGLLHGASESLRKPFFLIVTLVAIAFIVQMYRSMERGQALTKWALPLVLGGAIGNLVDRVRLGYVVDFIHAHWRTHHWPTFNVADIAITVGIGLMVLEYILGPKSSGSPRPARDPAAPTAAS